VVGRAVVGGDVVELGDRQLGAYQVSPALTVTSTPPSLLSMTRRGLRGSIQMSWWSPWCGPLICLKVWPPSMLRSRWTCGTQTTFGLRGSMVRVV